MATQKYLGEYGQKVNSTMAELMTKDDKAFVAGVEKIEKALAIILIRMLRNSIRTTKL